VTINLLLVLLFSVHGRALTRSCT